MFLLKLAWKNMWRNRNRTAITMSAIFFAVILSVLTSSLRTGIFDNLVKNMVSYYSGYIQVHKSGYWEEQNLDNSFPALPAAEASILSDSRISALTPRLESFALASVGEITKGCIVVGIDPLREKTITHLSDRLVEGRYLNQNDLSVMVAEGFLKRLGIGLNDTIILIGQGYHGASAAGKFRVCGVLHFGSPDLNDKAVVMPLRLAQDLYGAGGLITSYVLSIHNTGDLYSVTGDAREKLGKDYEVMNWEEMMPEIKQHISTDTRNMQVVHYILYLLICFGIFGTLLMLMAERKYELGMLLAIGMKKSKLVLTLVYESLLTVLLGCLLGIAVSIPIVYYLNIRPIRLSGAIAKAYSRFGFEPIFPTSLASEHFILQGGIVLILGLLLSLYPAFKVLRMNPVKAMRK